MQTPNNTTAHCGFQFAATNDAGETVLWLRGLANGRVIADVVIDYIRANEVPSLLGHVAKAQIECRAFGKSEIEFWQRVAQLA